MEEIVWKVKRLLTEKESKMDANNGRGQLPFNFGRNCKCQQEELQSRIKQLEREKHSSMAVALISDRSDALEDFGRNCKCQQEELQSRIKQLEREKHSSMAFALISDRSDALEDFGRNCKSQQEELQSRIKQLEREKHNSMAVALISDRSGALEDFGRNCKCQQEELQSRIKQLEREKHSSMAVALISDRSDALEDFGRNCKCQQEELQSRIKQLEREKHNRWEGMERRLPILMMDLNGKEEWKAGVSACKKVVGAFISDNGDEPAYGQIFIVDTEQAMRAIEQANTLAPPCELLEQRMLTMARTVDFRLWKGIAKANKRTTKQEQAVGRREAQQNCYGLERLKVLSREGLGSSGNCRNWIDTSESRWQYVEALNWLGISLVIRKLPQLDRQKWKLLTLYVEALHRHSVCFCCVDQSPNGRRLLLDLPPDITSDGLWKTKSGTPNLEANTGDQEDTSMSYLFSPPPFDHIYA
ncbi:hypothetical protein GPALN_003750 [Globodera pallida]|nr:hypothetical protein GPALN_003750 [Globodera pallida]